MPIHVLIPTPLRTLTGGQDTVTADAAEAGTVEALIATLEARHPGIRARLYKADGTLGRFINIYINDEDIRFLQGVETPLKDGDHVSIVPAVAGGKHVQRYTLTFSSLMRNEPILYNLGKKYQLIVNLEKANLSDEAGWVQVAFQGDEDEIQRALADLHGFGVTITPVEIAALV